jgi:hypothetical protein
MRMRMRKPRAERDPAAMAIQPARPQRPSAGGGVSPRIAWMLELQRTAGNRAVARALAATRATAASPSSGHPKIQRWSLDWDDVVDFVQWTNPLTAGSKAIRHFTGVELNLWEAAEMAVRASATKISIPSAWVDKLKAYAAYNPDDGKKLRDALDVGPSHYQGGLLLGGNKDAAAITFGNSIFYGTADVDTYVHEMVHIHQYHTLGRMAFLGSYFGLSLATIIKRVLAGQSLDAMKSSPHEQEAYNLEARFKAWRASHP